MKIQAALATVLFATSAFASPQIGHIFSPNTSQSFDAQGRVSSNISLIDAKGKALTLNTQNQLTPANVDPNSLSAADQNVVRVSSVKIGFDSKTKISYVQLQSGKSDSIPQQIARISLGQHLQMDSEMRVTNFDSLQATAAQTGQNIAVSLARTPGEPNHVDYTNDQSCTITRQIPDGEDCHWVSASNGELFCSRLPAQFDGQHQGRGDHGQDGDHGPRGDGNGPRGDGNGQPAGPGAPAQNPGDQKPDQPKGHQVCEPKFRTIFIDGSQTCRTFGDTWSDGYTMNLGNSASYQWRQDYSTVTTNCSPCIPNHRWH